MKGISDNATAIGWSAEAFARTKTMKPLGDYLKPEPTAVDMRAKGAADVGAMLRRLEARSKG